MTQNQNQQQQDHPVPPVPHLIRNHLFIYKVGSIISVMHEFLRLTNNNEFLSSCYYYYNVVRSSDRGHQCPHAQAAHRSLISTYQELGPEAHAIISDLEDFEGFLPPELATNKPQLSTNAPELTTNKAATAALSPLSRRTARSLTSHKELLDGIRSLKTTLKILSLMPAALKRFT